MTTWPKSLGDPPKALLEWEFAIVKYTKPSDTTKLISAAEDALAAVAEVAASHFEDLCTCDDALTFAQSQFEVQRKHADDAEIKLEEMWTELKNRSDGNKELVEARSDLAIIENYIAVAEKRRLAQHEDVERLMSELVEAKKDRPPVSISGLRKALLEYSNKYNVSNHDYDIIHGVFEVFDAYVESHPEIS